MTCVFCVASVIFVQNVYHAIMYQPASIHLRERDCRSSLRRRITTLTPFHLSEGYPLIQLSYQISSIQILTYRLEKRHEATYISNLRTYRFHLKCPIPKLQVSVSETPPSDACVEGHQDLSLPIFAGSHWRPLSEILRTAVKMIKGIQTS